MNESRDFTIIGGGATGLFPVSDAGMRDPGTRIMDSLCDLRGRFTVLYPGKHINDT